MEHTKKRHGDVRLDSSVLPEGAIKLDEKLCRCKTFQPCAKHMIFAYGEVSGHVHQAVCELEMDKPALEFYELNGELYAKNTTDQPVHLVQSHGPTTAANIAHLEKCYAVEGLHAPIRDAVLPKQTVHIVFPREYDWHSGEIQRARD